ncbi:hypothetical protein HDU90_008204 [Geranomyces variabilis]|nr:hypothetical protein HDU90_008204 [Geranomyces variabilis]
MLNVVEIDDSMTDEQFEAWLAGLAPNNSQGSHPVSAGLSSSQTIIDLTQNDEALARQLDMANRNDHLLYDEELARRLEEELNSSPPPPMSMPKGHTSSPTAVDSETEDEDGGLPRYDGIPPWSSATPASNGAVVQDGTQLRPILPASPVGTPTRPQDRFGPHTPVRSQNHYPQYESSSVNHKRLQGIKSLGIKKERAAVAKSAGPRLILKPPKREHDTVSSAVKPNYDFSAPAMGSSSRPALASRPPYGQPWKPPKIEPNGSSSSAPPPPQLASRPPYGQPWKRPKIEPNASSSSTPRPPQLQPYPPYFDSLYPPQGPSQIKSEDMVHSWLHELGPPGHRTIQPRPIQPAASAQIKSEDLVNSWLRDIVPPSHANTLPPPQGFQYAGQYMNGIKRSRSQFGGEDNGSDTEDENAPYPMPDRRLENNLPAGVNPLYPVNDAETKEQLRALLENVSHTEEVTPKELRLPTPPELAITLLEHQKISLEWMLKMEQSTNKGGILADDMGLGKTVSSIALIVSNPAPPDNPPFSDPLHSPKPTLIVAPVSLLIQWEKEIRSKLKPGKRLSVLLHHGPSRLSNPAEIARFDVILTSYHVMMGDWPRPPQKPRRKRGVTYDAVLNQGFQEQVAEYEAEMERWEDPAYRLAEAGPLFRINYRRIILDEAHMIKNKATQGARAAYDLHAIYRWCLTGTPIQNNIGELFSLLHFLDIKPFCEWTTFRMKIVSPLQGRSDSSRNAAMQRVQNVLKAVCLRRNKRTVFDGKPIIELPPKVVSEDRMDFSSEEREFYTALEQRAQIRFSRYLKKGTVMKNYANVLVLLLRLRQACLHPYLITKDFEESAIADGGDDAGGPPLSDAERYKQVMDSWAQDVKDRLAANSLEQECAICLDVMTAPIITTCGHLFCSECITAVLASPNIAEPSDRTCPTCRGLLNLGEGVPVAAYKAAYRPDEVREASAEPVDRKGKGPVKDEPEEADEDDNADPDDILNDLDMPRYTTSSTKIERLLTVLEETRQQTPREKTIVFSQFRTMLDLCADALHRRKFKFVRYDGGMSAIQRNDALSQLQDDDEVTVLLVSLKCGSLGLNLTFANRVILLDVWWSPAVEMQAVDRVHRFGQQREVFVFRSTIKNSVEDRILKLQDEKKALFDAALREGDYADGGVMAPRRGAARLSLQDLIALFDVQI